VTIIMGVGAEPGDLREVVQMARIAILLDGERPSARLALETWVIEEALSRLGERRLTEAQQQVVVASARMPHKVRWPAWWSSF
jgi:hypothetical protein